MINITVLFLDPDNVELFLNKCKKTKIAKALYSQGEITKKILALPTIVSETPGSAIANIKNATAKR